MAHARKGRVGFLGVPIPLLDPTIGAGLAAVAMVMYPSQPHDTVSPPSHTALFGGYTSTNSWLAGVNQSNYGGNDRYRFDGTVMYLDLNLKFWGIGESKIPPDNPIDYNFRGFYLTAKQLFRLRDTPWLFGGRYHLFATANNFKLPPAIDSLVGVPSIKFDVRTAGISGVTNHDSRDHTFTPKQGNFSEAILSYYGKAFGGQAEYLKFEGFFRQFLSLSKRWVLCSQFIFNWAGDNTVYFDVPYVRLRGFAEGRHQDFATTSIEAEGRWTFAGRWGAVFFGGLGWAAGSPSAWGLDRTIPAGGVGIRFLADKEQKVNVGLDIAVSEDNVAFYFQLGEWF